MKIMWLCNVPISQICEKLEIKNSVLGGWLNGASGYILEGDHQLVYLFPYKNRIEGELGNLTYIGYVENNVIEYDDLNEVYFSNLINKYKPDVIHVWGTESVHSLEMVNAALRNGMSERLVVSIQGIISECAKVYTVGIKESALKGKTLRDIIRKDSILKQKDMFKRRGENEKEIIKKVKNVIGRTDWDKRVCYNINPAAKYHKCNESLRSEFYTAKKWDYEKCRKHSVFCSQGSYPIKGFHIALEAFKLIKDKYPDLEIRITGNDYVRQSFIQRQKRTYYYTYLRDLIVKNGLESSVKFLGSLDAGEIIKEYQRANVFLSASLLENSSNSIGEAMMIGTPVISSNVGGCSSIIDDGRTGILYDVTDVNAIAKNVEKLFEDVSFANNISEEARKVAFERHNGKKNNNDLTDIYNSLLQR